MEYVHVSYEKDGRPILRNVYVRTQRDPIGKTNSVIRIGKGVQRFHLGPKPNYSPEEQRVVLRNTSRVRPKEVLFTPFEWLKVIADGDHEVRLDGEAVGRTNAVINVPAGRHTITAAGVRRERTFEGTSQNDPFVLDLTDEEA